MSCGTRGSGREGVSGAPHLATGAASERRRRNRRNPLLEAHPQTPSPWRIALEQGQPRDDERETRSGQDEQRAAHDEECVAGAE